MLTLLGPAAAPPLLWRVLPVVQLHAEGTPQGRGGLWVGDLHDVDVTVGGAEIAAVQGGHLGLGLLEGGPRPVLQHSGKLRDKRQGHRTARRLSLKSSLRDPTQAVAIASMCAEHQGYSSPNWMQLKSNRFKEVHIHQ